MEIIFLGTSGMHPTKERNLFSVLFRYKSENILIDCGEGTQRQLRMINIPSTKTNKILLTHLHGDHINGLPGLLQNLQANQYSKDLEIYGPVGLKKLMYHIFEIAGLRMRVKINEIKSGIIYKSKDFYVEAKELQHSSKVYGYSFTEHDKRKINMNYLKKFNLKRHVLLGNLQKGKDVVYNGKKIKAKDATTLVKGRKLSLITDTVYCDNCIKLAKTYGLEKHGPNKKYMVSFQNAFHGRTLGAQLAGGNERQKKWMAPKCCGLSMCQRCGSTSS